MSAKKAMRGRWHFRCFSLALSPAAPDLVLHKPRIFTVQTEIFTLCDAATVAGGKLNVLGSFDTIGAQSFPCDHPLCAVACKLRFDVGEEGRHWLEMHFCDPDMRPVLKPIRQDFEIRIPGHQSQTHIHIWQHLGFHLERLGDYYFELKVDGDTKSRIPLYVVQAQRR
ncbi:MAG: hypothetical protein AUH91_02690 [Verrucomicrobia bacterium 13_1_40CM_4_54_4]|nr:MAG: hypothetical protein AUH91_02690 [Verrucomicrobia bacterium 13_1_40CM_4_54_4]